MGFTKSLFRLLLLEVCKEGVGAGGQTERDGDGGRAEDVDGPANNPIMLVGSGDTTDGESGGVN